MKAFLKVNPDFLLVTAIRMKMRWDSKVSENWNRKINLYVVFCLATIFFVFPPRWFNSKLPRSLKWRVGALNFFDSRRKILEKQFPHSEATISLWEPYYISSSKQLEVSDIFCSKSQYLWKYMCFFWKYFTIYHKYDVSWFLWYIAIYNKIPFLGGSRFEKM